jgi:uncharacterized protein YlaI
MQPTRCEICGRTEEMAGGTIESVEFRNRCISMCPICRSEKPSPEADSRQK